MVVYVGHGFVVLLFQGRELAKETSVFVENAEAAAEDKEVEEHGQVDEGHKFAGSVGVTFVEFADPGTKDGSEKLTEGVDATVGILEFIVHGVDKTVVLTFLGTELNL